jgi:preprotein translocase SecF subunit
MAVYILFAFAGMRDLVSPFLLGIVTVFTMLFDVSIASGAYGMMMAFNNTVQVDTIFIIALLTVLGYSVNDTIVIFDRIRENFIEKREAIDKGKYTRAEIFEMSLRQTMRRSIGTSVSTLLIVTAMFVFGTGILKMFAFTLGVGVIAGTYSSIFLAAPFAYLLSSRTDKSSSK